ncbi:hypothetical protein SNEBB_009095 [Seison nebaliae]|nr:hypothetical protein SNEBB_009095 [Seison nebaliae]
MVQKKEPVQNRLKSLVKDNVVQKRKRLNKRRKTKYQTENDKIQVVSNTDDKEVVEIIENEPKKKKKNVEKNDDRQKKKSVSSKLKKNRSDPFEKYLKHPQIEIDHAEERRLTVFATKGVSKLFNIIRHHQLNLSEKLDVSSERKKDEILFEETSSENRQRIEERLKKYSQLDL